MGYANAGKEFTVNTTSGHTYYTFQQTTYVGPMGGCSVDFHIYDYIPRNIFYTVHYKITNKGWSAAMALGWVYTGGTIPLRSSGYRPHTPWAKLTETVGTISFWANTDVLSWYKRSMFTVNNSTEYLQSIGTSGLIVSTTLNSSSTAVGNLSNTTALTNTATRYSSSTAKAYLSSITDLTNTATRYSSSVAVGNLSSTTELRTITRL